MKKSQARQFLAAASVFAFMAGENITPQYEVTFDGFPLKNTIPQQRTDKEKKRKKTLRKQKKARKNKRGF